MEGRALFKTCHSFNAKTLCRCDCLVQVLSNPLAFFMIFSSRSIDIFLHKVAILVLNKRVRSSNKCYLHRQHKQLYLKTEQAILSQFFGSAYESNVASKFVEMIRKYGCRFKGMTGLYLNLILLKKYLHNNRPFNVPMQATVYMFRHITCCLMGIYLFCIHQYGSFG